MLTNKAQITASYEASLEKNATLMTHRNRKSPNGDSGMLRLYKNFQQAARPVSDLRLICHLLNNYSLYMSTILIYFLSINIGNNLIILLP